MDRQFKTPRWGPPQRQRRDSNPFTPPLFGMGKRHTDPLSMQDYYQRINSGIWEADQDTYNYPQRTVYKAPRDQNILDSLSCAATKHILSSYDWIVPRKMVISSNAYQCFLLFMRAYDINPNEGFTYARQGDEQTTRIFIEEDESIPTNIIICIN